MTTQINIQVAKTSQITDAERTCMKHILGIFVDTTLCIICYVYKYTCMYVSYKHLITHLNAY